MRRTACIVVLAVTFAAGVAWGLAKLDERVHRKPRFLERPQLVLLNAPEGLDDKIRESLGPLLEQGGQRSGGVRVRAVGQRRRTRLAQ